MDKTPRRSGKEVYFLLHGMKYDLDVSVRCGVQGHLCYCYAHLTTQTEGHISQVHHI